VKDKMLQESEKDLFIRNSFSALNEIYLTLSAINAADKSICKQIKNNSVRQKA
jgi:hypothetical protein